MQVDVNRCTSRSVVQLVLCNVAWYICTCSCSRSVVVLVVVVVYLSICLSASLKTKLFCETSSVFELDNIKNETILRDFLSWQHQKRNNSARLPQFSKLTTSKTKQFCAWQHQKRNNSARLPQFLNLATSKTKQFCETSSIFEVDNIKNETILRDFLEKWKVECRADVCFAIFPLLLSKVLRLPRKSDARSNEVLHLSRKIISAKLKILCSKMQPLSGNQRPDLLTALMNMSLVLRLRQKMHLCRSSSNVPRLPSFLEMLQNLHVLLTFDKVHNPLRLPRESISERPKALRTPQFFAPKCASRHNDVHFFDIATSKRTWCALRILTSKYASRHNGVHFFDISTSKSGPDLVCFVHFDIEMCFAPHRRALFRHLNFQKWSGAAVFCTFWHRNVLRATPACTFSTSQLPKVVRSCCVLYILTSKCASRHNGPECTFDIEMCFAPQRCALFRHLNFLSSGQLALHPPL